VSWEPEAFPLKPWENEEEGETTPVDKSSLQDVERRLGSYASSPAALPEIADRCQEQELGAIEGHVELDCSAASLFVGELVGATTIKFTDAPSRPYEATLLLTQAGEYHFEIEGLVWVADGEGKEPEFTLTPGSRYAITVLIRKGGAEIIGRA